MTPAATGIAELGWLAAAVIVPLALNPWGCNAFELPKALLLQTIALWMLFVALLFPAANAGRRAQWSSPLLWTGCALALVLLLSTLFSTNPRLSFWGAYARQQGFLTFIGYLILAGVVATRLRTPLQARRLLLALTWTSAPVVIYGLLQAARLDPITWHTDAASMVLSTIGRSNFTGSYLVLVIPLTLFLACQSRRAWPYVLLLSGQVVLVGLTQARGAWIGLAVGGLTFALVWSLATRNRRLAMIALGSSALAIAFVALLNLPGGPLAPLAELPGLERLGSLGATATGSTAARLTIWRATIPLVLARPWLGYGPETMETAFARVYPPQLVYYQGRATVVDRAHNLWLDTAMSAGVLGALALAALLAAVGWMIWRGLQAAQDRQVRLLYAALAAAIAGHLVDLQFGFELSASATVFWLLLGLCAALYRQDALPSPPRTAPRPRPHAWGLAISSLAFLAFLGFLVIRPLLADMTCWRAERVPAPPAERHLAAQAAVRLWPTQVRYRLNLAGLQMQLALFQQAESQLMAAEALLPDSPSLWMERGELYSRWGEVDPQRYRQAEAALLQALQLAPNVARYHVAYGLLLARLGRLTEGVAQLESAVALDATDGVGYAALAQFYRAQGRLAEAERADLEARRWLAGE